MSLPLLLTLTAVLPQGPGKGPELSWEYRRTLSFPSDAKAEKLQPFGSGPTPVCVTTAAAGLADLDGDGIKDAWFLGASGQTQGTLSLQHGKNSAPGRYRDFAYGPVACVTDTAWAHATTYHSSWYGNRERVLAIGPSSDKLANVFFQRSSQTDPTQGTITVDASGWAVPLGSYEIAARDCDGNGHDDVTILTAIPGGTEVRKLVIGAPYFYLAPVYEVVGQVPLNLTQLRCFDCDGDRSDDVVAYAPGFGIVGLRDDGQRHFVLAFVLPLPTGVVDLQIGDLDADGREDLVVTTSDAVAAITFGGAASKILLATRPAAVARFTSARVLDGDGDGKADLVATCEDARAVVVYGFDPQWTVLAPARVLTPTDSQLSEYPTGVTALGQSCMVGDVDNDGDKDLLLQLGTGKSWVLLRSPTVVLAPREIEVVHLGPLTSGSTLLKEQLGARLPPEWTSELWDQIEVGYYMQDLVDKSKYHLRATQIVALDGITTRIDLPVWYEKDPAKHAFVQAAPSSYLGLPYLTGDVVVFIHGKQSESVMQGRPPRRFQSLVIRHEVGGDEQKSAGGVAWSTRQAPPLPTTDAELLPWQ